MVMGESSLISPPRFTSPGEFRSSTIERHPDLAEAIRPAHKRHNARAASRPTSTSDPDVEMENAQQNRDNFISNAIGSASAKERTSSRRVSRFPELPDLLFPPGSLTSIYPTPSSIHIRVREVSSHLLRRRRTLGRRVLALGIPVRTIGGLGLLQFDTGLVGVVVLCVVALVRGRGVGGRGVIAVVVVRLWVLVVRLCVVVVLCRARVSGERVSKGRFRNGHELT
jgi:hypothetical protein